jgi:hypothetical protein
MLARSAPNGRRDQAGDASHMRELVTRLPAGALIEVRLFNREKVHGHLGPVKSDGFAVKSQDPSASERFMAFIDVKSVKTIQNTRGRVAVLIIAGVLVAVVVVAVAAYLKFRHNEGA